MRNTNKTIEINSKFINKNFRMNKYRLTDETTELCGITLYRIVCVNGFANVKAGDKGGYIESENNLSQYGNCWIYGNAKVYGNARVYANARIYGNAWVYGNARVYGNAQIYCNAWVYGNAQIYGDAIVSGSANVNGDARIYGDALVRSNFDYIVFKNSWSSGRYFTWTRSNDMWKIGCFYGTGKELIRKAYQDSTNSGKHYEAYVNFVEQLKQLEKYIFGKSSRG